MEISIDTKQVIQLEKRIIPIPRKVKRRMDDLRNKAEGRLLEAMTARASGPPGPNVQTGAYISSFYTFRDGDTIVGGNRSPQAARLEYGFFGVDSMGRNYAQAARPHMRPALIETQMWMLDEVGRIIRDEVRL